VVWEVATGDIKAPSCNLLGVWWLKLLKAAVPWRTVMRWVGALLGVAVALLAIVVLLGPITDLIASHDVSSLTQVQRAGQMQSARETARTQLLTLGAGVFAAGAVWFTARNYLLSREGQVTDRYTKAIDQLGSDKLDVRIGGIYALERIARDSARDRITVMQVLSAFIREHSHEHRSDANIGSSENKSNVRSDVEAALSVVSRQYSRRDNQGVSLAGANLVGLHLVGANLSNSNLTRTTLCDANLADTHFRSANLKGANLTNSNLSGALFSGANLRDANLTNTILVNAAFVDVDLTGAKLARAALDDAIIFNVNLENADLADTDLTGVNLINSPAPEGWQIRAGSFRLERVDTSADSGTAN
jgi:uncharacterized protein YjbI with pentapeptide repeats